MCQFQLSNFWFLHTLCTPLFCDSSVTNELKSLASIRLLSWRASKVPVSTTYNNIMNSLHSFVRSIWILGYKRFENLKYRTFQSLFFMCPFQLSNFCWYKRVVYSHPLYLESVGYLWNSSKLAPKKRSYPWTWYRI